MFKFLKPSREKELSHYYVAQPILIIEDDHKYQDLYSRLLSKTKCPYKIVDHPQKAIEFIAQGKRFPAMIVDLAFEGEPSGLDLLKTLKNQIIEYSKHGQGLAIVVSGHPEYKDRALLLGAFRFFDKKDLPEKEQEFIEAVKSAYNEGQEKIADLRLQEEKLYEKLKHRFFGGKTIEVTIEANYKNPSTELRSN
ncbi:hypothetical protein MNBD_CHLOROFLEXI01-5048 [hydrothermal vent metagenome]|uniref:Response regulatory domain-containing protein n=1 Tax=hydrothermal vent metagenome TaxID=652676 RepID=A0A3B0VCJ6_9ZZZZ